MDDDDFFTFYSNFRGITQLRCKEINNCDFPYNGEKVVWIPPPKKGVMKGVIISRDPTTCFIDAFNTASQKNDDDCRSNLMSNEGVPIKKLVCRIEKVCNSEGVEFSQSNLLNFFLEHCYWTHLLKCYTYSGRKRRIQSLPFPDSKRAHYVDNCSEKHLYRELEYILKLADVKIIILLGADVTKFVYGYLFKEEIGNWRESRIKNNCTFLPFPHPSGANGKEWKQPYKKALLSNIGKLKEFVLNEGT